MKTLKTLFSILLLFTLLAPMSYAADAVAAATSTIVADPTTAIAPGTQTAILQFILHLAGAHSWVASVILFMGLSRVWAKPICSVVHFMVDLTPSTADNGAVNAAMLFFTSNPTGKFISFMLDWVTSIKIVAPTTRL